MGMGLRWDVRRYDVLDSTNLEARRLLARGAREGLVVTAAHQTAGRGRMDRSWLDRPGKSLLASLVFRKKDPFAVAALVAVSVRAAVRSLGGEGPLCKWPNDLVYGKRKVGGLLAESFRHQGTDFLIVGLGLNVGYLPEELNFFARLPPTSLLIEEGKSWSAEEILHALLCELEGRIREGLRDSMEEYQTNMAYRGYWVVVENYVIKGPAGEGREEQESSLARDGTRLEGILAGVDESGNLLLEVGKNTISVVAGDLSPLHGK
ncbi:biotin--[acetyl-CoA-carboxylase] ligase [Candidatus Solincola tengchongensis]|uniref:biotin--[acetyl-CoA-carboxylase] ligase n=1 Tax=Candidatus Solincola tengchongensis TaxID=2900693 RepID=UPI002579A57E|nr:biotin--[acetyl-CoA-carboxylase] ligase [Candidatus Solincola tengchongensis]